MRIATYRGIGIIESYGYYSPSIDRTIEDINLHKVVEWIDKKLGYVTLQPIVDRYIIGEYVMKEFYSRN